MDEEIKANRNGQEIQDRNDSQSDLKQFMYSRQKTDPNLFRWTTAKQGATSGSEPQRELSEAAIVLSENDDNSKL